ncbi:two-component regulator propeller domain-containing protein [Clostridium sp. AL.422]|uniref:ligand-binding sensor domain-containing protein n=1 Tax=Clostridium TaxID=1485 RepID=UPI00293DC1F9|nr:MULTISPECIES: two-component regulator propeller domain-containing protein [unclassified Clostridium]MDV4151466.1 two-component regulator propeller domain-containing protein [Clostridium sp. AL.422]
MRKKVKRIMSISILAICIFNNLCLRTSALSNDENNITFRRITVEDGLSQTTVQYIFQDSKGYMWIATIDGLNRYNGHDFKVYKYSDRNEDSISMNYISAVNEDEDGNIWVGTSSGLNKIDSETEEITTYLSGVYGCKLSNDNITEILIDSNKDIYIATTDGLNLYDKRNDNFIRIYGESDDNNNLTSQDIYSIDEDLYGDLWIGTKEGLNKVNRKTNEITNYYANGLSNSISENFIFKIYADDSNNLWIGTYDSGLDKLDIETNKIEHYKHDPSDDNSISGNSIRYILKDSNNKVWVATNNGLSMLEEENNGFINYRSKIYDPQSLVSDDILSLVEDNSGAIWIGTYDGISIFNGKNSFINYKRDYFNSNSLSSNMVAGIHKDDEGLIWVGTVQDGINVIDRENNSINKYKASSNENSLSNNNIRDITGIDDEIWIATENGLTKYDKKTKKFTKYFHEGENSLISNDVRSLYIDKDGDLWITTDDGVCIFDRKSNFKSYKQLFLDNEISEKVFSGITQDKDGEIWIGSSLNGGLIRINKDTEIIKAYRNESNNEKSISFNVVKTIAVDDNNTVWVGTQYGLNKFNREDETFTRYDESDGLTNNFIYGILVDDENNLWISTNYGISKYDVKLDKFINYDDTDGLQGNEFNGYSFHKANDGEMFFGGTNGITTFYPQNLEEKNFLPKVVIGSAYTNQDELLDKEKIKLSYKNNNIYFDFFLPDYANVKRIQYAHKLVGLDKEWILSDNRNYVNYTNLDAGDYIFMVSARNSTGDWSEPTSIEFTVEVKPWKSPIAYMTYLLLAFVIVYITWNRVKILDTLVEQRTNELNKKLNENEELYNKLIKNEKYKNNYFINLSHELRTPLNVIISVEQLVTKLNGDKKNISRDKLNYYMDTVKRNSDRLLKLINNIIDTSKIEAGSYRLDIKEHNIVYLVEDVVLSMKDYIESKGIELIIDPEMEEKIIECDEGEIEKCIVNLVGNAVKFTEAGGRIEVRIRDFGNSVKISVKDTGVGIDRKYHKAIFDRFGQAYNNISEEFGGSGLGLTLTKQLVTLHKGKIYVESEVDKGSEFIIILPTKQR